MLFAIWKWIKTASLLHLVSNFLVSRTLIHLAFSTGDIHREHTMVLKLRGFEPRYLSYATNTALR